MKKRKNKAAQELVKKRWDKPEWKSKKRRSAAGRAAVAHRKWHPVKPPEISTAKK